MNAPGDFRAAFTASRQLPARSYENALFFECAPLHVLAFTLFCDGASLPLLERDYALIRRVSGARFLEDVEAALEEHGRPRPHEPWTRRVGGCRISTRKLRRIARRILPSRVGTQ